jgi:ABC-2 type transport system permease protein
MTNPPAGELGVGTCIVVLAILCVVMFTGGLYIFDRSLRLARRLGILGI